MKYRGIDAVATKIFTHSGLIYPYSLHGWKLREFCGHEGLRNFLLGIGPWIDRYFASSKRCSQLDQVQDVEVFEKKDYLCAAAGLALSACSDLKERHALVQKHLLFNDVSTIATEVPLWAYDKKIGAISGHADILQIRDGKVFVVDYKPGAALEPKKKVASQLFWYAPLLFGEPNNGTHFWQCQK